MASPILTFEILREARRELERVCLRLRQLRSMNNSLEQAGRLPGAAGENQNRKGGA